MNPAEIIEREIDRQIAFRFSPFLENAFVKGCNGGANEMMGTKSEGNSNTEPEHHPGGKQGSTA